eukprot:4321699-Lingulodinium_polyedra.AAC.1
MFLTSGKEKAPTPRRLAIGTGVPACRRDRRVSWHQMPYRLLPSADAGCSAAHRKIGSPRLSLISLRHF